MHSQRWGKALSFAFFAVMMADVATASPFFEVISGGAYRLNRQGVDYVRKPARLQESDRLETGRSKLCFVVDYRAGSVCMEKFALVDLLKIRRDESGCIDEIIQFEGDLVTAFAPFRCPTSRILFIAGNGATYTIAGTQTEFESGGDTSQVIVLTGEVVARQNKGQVIVPAGFGAIVVGQNDPELFKIDWGKNLVVKEVRGKYEGFISLGNTLLLNEKPVPLDDMGKFSVAIEKKGNGDVFTVLDPLGNRRSH